MDPFEYSKQQTFSKQQVQEIIEKALLGLKIQAAKIFKLDKQIIQQKKIIDLIDYSESLIIKLAQTQCTIDILSRYWHLKVYLWVIEWALRSRQQDILDILLQKYFKGITIELRSDSNCCHTENCQIVKVMSSYVQLAGWNCQYIHIIYQDSNTYESNRLPIQPIINNKTDEQAEKDLFLYSIIKYYFNLPIIMIGHLPNFTGESTSTPIRDLRLGRFAKDGKMLSYNLEGTQKIYCRNSQLCIEDE